jgi:uncharacterized protein YcfJ
MIRYRFRSVLSGLAVATLLSACATMPMGPSVNVMPSPTEPFSVFQNDQATCRAYAQNQVASQANRANNQAVGGAALGVVAGALLGAAVGNGHGAVVGAGIGLVGGSAVGANSSSYAQGSIQQQYDNAYVQCMYAKGAQVPGVDRRGY